MNNSFFVHSSSSTSETLRNEVIGADLQNDAGMESSVNISEVFVDYVHLERTTGKAIADAIVKSLHDMGFDIKNLRGQGYDGATDQELQQWFHAATTLVESAGGVVSQPDFQDDSSIVIIIQQKPQRHIIGEMLQFHSTTICSKRWRHILPEFQNLFCDLQTNPKTSSRC